WCTYTDPEIAHTGMYEHEAAKKGIKTTTFMQTLEDVDRSITDGRTEGFAKILVKRGSDTILGATIVAPHAGEMISGITLAIVGKVGLRTIARTIHPYPTVAEAIKKATDAYNRSRLTPLTKSILRLVFRLRR
ncbi:MAG: FAD-containing oxidoreductase, partial [Chitinivibrionales bacterium]|nr:FAD-containing oxidoreductase [Chitinivibrionales bacterium]MBD3358146.1 FAD-containing oxidoreductase [Chitinivibrionales bacterium]